MKLSKWKTTAWLMLLVVCMMMVTGCGQVVPPGTTVMILKPRGNPIIKHEGVFKAWGRDKVYFVDTKLQSYSKQIEILCADDINMSVRLKWIGSFKVDTKTIDVIKKKVPATPVKKGEITGYQLSLDKFFKTAMEDMFSATARDIISPYVTDNIREKRAEIQKTVKEQFLTRLSKLNYPVETADVLITNLDYPKEVTAMRKKIKQEELRDLENAAIAKANVAKAKRNAELAAEQGKAQLVEAQADAAANKVRSESLTPAILAVKQLETLVELAKGDNNTVVVIPYDSIKTQNGNLQSMLLNRESMERLTKALAQTTPQK
jgi:regulator of protease activity HflC (stomatin/prohibitin superfamily)